MRFSIFTPTHNAAFLFGAVESLLAQTFTDWEMLILPNGDVNAALCDDPRVRVLPHSTLTGVGALKAAACAEARGEYLVELDHDDLLTDDALAIIDQAISATGADFLYSDCAEFRHDGTPNLYGKQFGWEHYAVNIDKVPYIVNRPFKLDARSMCEIFYAPNHVRVWKASTYRAVGGHDASLAVCDDFDLLIRTYLSGAKFHHIPECLYLYRIREDGGNTWLTRNAEIQTKQRELHNKHLHALVAEWCRRETLPMLDLGGAHNKPDGYESVDFADFADHSCDIRFGLPFDDSSVGCIRAADFLEHIPSCGMAHAGVGAHVGCTVFLMNEIHRVLVPGGWLLTRTPSTDGRGAWQDPTHCSGWSVPNSFWYYSRSEQQKFVPGISAKFQLTRAYNEFPNDWCKTHNIVYGCADLVALKGQRVPGICEI